MLLDLLKAPVILSLLEVMEAETSLTTSLPEKNSIKTPCAECQSCTCAEKVGSSLGHFFHAFIDLLGDAGRHG